MGFPGGSVVKNLPTNAGNAEDTSSIPGSRRSSGAGNGNPPSYLCLENSMAKEPGGLLSVGLKRVGHD